MAKRSESRTDPPETRSSRHAEGRAGLKVDGEAGRGRWACVDKAAGEACDCKKHESGRHCVDAVAHLTFQSRVRRGRGCYQMGELSVSAAIT